LWMNVTVNVKELWWQFDAAWRRRCGQFLWMSLLCCLLVSNNSHHQSLILYSVCLAGSCILMVNSAWLLVVNCCYISVVYATFSCSLLTADYISNLHEHYHALCHHFIPIIVIVKAFIAHLLQSYRLLVTT